jgi:hypothetical protein
MTTNSIEYAEGNFTFFNSKDACDKYKDAYDAITITESWAFMREDPGSGGFMFLSNPERYKIINDNMKLFGYHSGGSYSCMMRHMQYIANHGWNKYVDAVIAAKN